MRYGWIIVLWCVLTSWAAAQVVDLPPVDELRARRKVIYDKIDQGIGILPGAQKQAGYVEFRQSADFFYLTGLEVPDCYLFLEGKTRKEVLYVPARPLSEQWEGPIYESIEAIKATTGIGDVRVIARRPKLDEELAKLVGDAPRSIFIGTEPEEIGVIINDSAGPAYSARAKHPWERFTQREHGFKKLLQEKFPKHEIKSLSGIIRTMRLIKQPSEIAALRKASEYSALAMVATIKGARPGRFEYELGAINDFEAKVRGAQGPAYQPIVGTGPNSCILHYSKKNRRIADGDIIVCDAACSYSYYVSDITRTFPANGKFSAEQKHVYNAVLEAQMACIKEAGPGVPLHRLEQLAREVLKKYELDRFFIHGLSHHVGFAVHDPMDFGTLKEGHVFTIEPGAYLSDRGLGVRIEDVILITKDGCEVLTKDCPKTVEEIEAMMAGNR